MKAIVLKNRGSADVLKVVNIPDPTNPKSNEVIIRLKAAGVNYAEILARRGIYSWVPKEKQFVLGMEGAGIVEEVGSDVSEFSVGDPVIIGHQYGCQAEKIKISEKFVFPAVETYSYEENAAFAVSFLTAYVALTEMARVRPKESVLIHAAAGGLGTATIQLGKALGLDIAGTSSSTQKVEFLRNQMELEIATTYACFRDEIKRWRPNGVDVVIESVGGKVFRDSWACLASLGRIVVVGISSVRFSKFKPWTWWSAYRTLPKVNILSMLGRSQGVLSFHTGRLLFQQYERMRFLFRELVMLINEHSIRPVVDSTFPLDAIGEAHRRIENRQNIGKVIISIM